MAFNKEDRFFRVIADTNTGFDFKGQILKYIGPSFRKGPEPNSIVLEQPQVDMDGKRCAAGGNLTIDYFKTEEVFRCFEVTPKNSSGMKFDAWIFRAETPWHDALSKVEDLLEEQGLNSDEQIPWDGIGVNMECVWKTREQLNNLDSDE